MAQVRISSIKFTSATAQLSGTGTLSATGTATAKASGAAAPSGSGTLSVTATMRLTASVGFSGVGNDNANGVAATPAAVRISKIAFDATPLTSFVRISSVKFYSLESTRYWNGTAWTDPVSAEPQASGFGTLRVTGSPALSSDVAFSGAGTAEVTGLGIGPSLPLFSGTGQLVVTAAVSHNGVTIDFSSVGVLTVTAVSTGSGTPNPPPVADGLYLYTPPTWTNTQTLEGALRYGITTSFLVYRKNGVWHCIQSPGWSDLDDADYIFTSPAVVNSHIAAELSAFGQGTLIHISE